MPCVKQKTRLLVMQATAILLIYKQWIYKNYNVYLGFDFIV